MFCDWKWGCIVSVEQPCLNVTKESTRLHVYRPIRALLTEEVEELSMKISEVTIPGGHEYIGSSSAKTFVQFQTFSQFLLYLCK